MGTEQLSLKRKLTISALIVVALVIVVVLFVPTLDVHKRQRALQATALGRLQRIIELQRSYAASHRTKRYSCDLAALHQSKPEGSAFDGDAFLVSDEQYGYRFKLFLCGPDGNGVVEHYKAAAVPVVANDGGFRFSAFCSDESGVIRYDSDGSATSCITTGTPISY